MVVNPIVGAIRQNYLSKAHSTFLGGTPAGIGRVPPLLHRMRHEAARVGKAVIIFKRNWGEACSHGPVVLNDNLHETRSLTKETLLCSEELRDGSRCRNELRRLKANLEMKTGMDGPSKCGSVCKQNRCTRPAAPAEPPDVILSIVGRTLCRCWAGIRRL